MSGRAAIIGVGCRLAGAHGPAAYDALLRAPPRAFAPLPPERWDPATYRDDAPARDRDKTFHGALLDDYAGDLRHLRLPPQQFERMHRMERVCLVTIVEALADAQLDPGDPLLRDAEVFVAATTFLADPSTDHSRRIRRYELAEPVTAAIGEHLAGRRAEIDEIIDGLFNLAAPPIEPDSMVSSASVTAGRVAKAYDIQGGHLAIDAGVGSSLVAVHRALRALEHGDCRVAVVCAVSPLLTAHAVLAFAHRGLLTHAHAVRPFVPAGDGTVLGEGCFALVLMDAAAARNRHAYAQLCGSATASFDPDKGPSALADATRDAVRRALDASGTEAREVALVETRACGAAEYDAAERAGLDAALAGAPALDQGRVGSAVAHVGFLQAASGLAALAHAAIALDKREYHGLVAGSDAPAAFALDGPVVVTDAGIDPIASAVVLRPVAHAEAARPRSERGGGAIRVSATRERLAVVGMGLCVPGAADVNAFWTNVKRRADAIGDLPKSRWDLDKLVGATRELAPLLKTRLAGALDEGALAQVRTFATPGQHPMDLGAALTLYAADQALRDAGFAPGKWAPERVFTVIGQLPIRAGELETGKRVLTAGHLALAAEAMREAGVDEDAITATIAAARARFERENPPLGPHALDELSSLELATGVARRFGFTGGAYAVDGACASALAALRIAREELLSEQCDVVIAGGCAANLVPEYYLALTHLGALSPRGAAPFARDASGFVPAEGAAVVVLKRLSDALAHGDRIHAVVSAIGHSSDGRGTSVFAPSSRGQQVALRRALREASVRPDEVDFLESHGAGTKSGDAAEMETYVAVYGDRDPHSPLTIGAVKSQIGHTSAAAGMVGLIKAALALRERTLPPSNMEGPTDPLLPLGGDHPLEIGTEPRPWVAPRSSRRVAAVSAFGLGGVNYHVLLEEEPGARRPASAEAQHVVAAPPRGPHADRVAVELCPMALPARPPALELRNRRVLVVPGEGALTEGVLRWLQSAGARASVVPADGAVVPPGDLAGVIDLSASVPRRDVYELSATAFADALRGASAPLFDRLRTVYSALATADWGAEALPAPGSLAASPPAQPFYVAFTQMGGDLGLLGERKANVMGAMVLGALKGLRQELPHVRVKTIDFAPDTPVEEMVRLGMTELCDASDRLEVAYAGGRRFVANLRRENHDASTPVARRVVPGETWVFSGGSRGIVFECAAALARLGARVVLLGRTTVPRDDAEWLALDDAAFARFKQEAFRRAREDDRTMTPTRFAAQFEVRERQRDLFRRLELVRRFDLPIAYLRCDVTQRDEVRAALARIRERFGAIHGLVHGAMVEWSQSLPKKTPELIARTLETKVVGLANLYEETRHDPLRSVVCFGSGAGRFGNLGQIDYSAANALMAAVLAGRARERPHVHHVTIDWTAWQGVGAAAANPDIATLVEAMNVTSIRPLEGVYWFLNELTLGRASEVVILEERMLYDWPCLGSQPERARGALTFDDRGRPLVEGEWPMLDWLVQLDGQGGAVFERRLDLMRDAFLDEHRLYGEPIVPGTFGCELLAEAAAASTPGWEVASLTDVRIGVPAKLHRGVPLTLRVTAAREPDESAGAPPRLRVESSSDLYVNGRLMQQSRAHHTGTVHMRAPGALGAEPRKHAIREPEGVARARSFFHMATDPVALGPLFCRAEWLHIGEREVVGAVRAPRLRDVMSTTSYPRFQLDPLVMDAALQIAANWDGHRNGYVSIPVGFARVEVGRLRRRDEAARVLARVVRVEHPVVVYDITVASAGNDDVLLELEGVQLRRIARLDGSDIEPAGGEGGGGEGAG